MINQPIKTGLLAFGMSGRIFHAPFLHAHEGFTFHAVTERSQKKVHEIYPGVKSYNTVDELLNDEELDLIIVNTPNNTHFEYAKQALIAGKDVLIEKPLCTSVSEAKELYELASDRQLYVMAFQNRRWDSDFLSVKNIIESNKLGKLIELHFRFDRYKPLIEAKAFKEEPIPGSGLAYNLGPHILDHAISLFGKPLEVQKTTAANRNGSKVDDYAFFHLSYEQNIQVYIYASLLVARPLPAFVIHGTKGSYIKDRTDLQEKQLDQDMSPLDSNYGFEIPGGEGELTLIDDKGVKTSEQIKAPRGSYIELFEAVYQQIRNNVPYPIKKEHILWQLEILERET